MNVKPERQTRADLNEYDANVDGGIEPNVNFGFGSKTVDPSSPPRVKNSISDLDVSGLASPVLGKRSRTEVETPPPMLAPVLSPSYSLFSRMDGGDSASGGSTRLVIQDHVRVSDSSWTPSRYPRSSSRSELNRSFPPHSHDGLSNVIGAMDATDGVNARTPDRRDVGGSPKVPCEDRRVKFRLSPPDVQPYIDQDEREHRHEPPKAAGAGLGNNYLNHPSPRSSPSDSRIQSSFSTAGTLSSQMEVLSGSEVSDVHGDQDAGCALRWKSRRVGLNEMATHGKMKVHAEECVNHVDEAGSMHGYHPNRGLSVVSVDGSDDGDEFDCAGLSGVSYHMERFTQTDASQDQDIHSARSSPLSCSTLGLCADADVETGSRGPPVGSCSTIPPRPHYSSLPSDRGSVFGSPLRNHAKDRTADDTPSPRSRSHLPSRPSLFKTPTLSLSPTPLAQVPYTHDVCVLQDTAELNAIGNSWLIQPHKRAHTDAQEFDTLRFSSSSPSTSISRSASAPSNLLLDDRDKPHENTDSEPGGFGPGFIGRPPFNGGLRSYMKADMTPDSTTRTGLKGGADGAQLKYDAPGCLLTSFINDQRANDDRSVLRHHVDSIEHRDMGGLEHESLGPLDPNGRTSPLPGFASRVSGVSAVGPLFHPALGTRLHSDEEGARSPASLDSRTMSIQSRSIDHGDGEEPEECGLLKSLLESSDPWGLMRKKVLNLPSPTTSDVERRRKRIEEDMVMVRGSLGRRGVGYVTPPSMDVLLGVTDLKEEVGVGEDEDSQEILDFRFSQPRTGHSPLFVRRAKQALTHLSDSLFHPLPDIHCGRSTPGLPPSNLAHTKEISSDPLRSPSPGSPRFRPYRKRPSHDDDRNNSDTDSKSRRSGGMGQSRREQSSYRSSDPSIGSGENLTTLVDNHDGLVQVGERRERLVTPSSSEFGSGSSVVVPKRKQNYQAILLFRFCFSPFFASALHPCPPPSFQRPHFLKSLLLASPRSKSVKRVSITGNTCFTLSVDFRLSVVHGYTFHSKPFWLSFPMVSNVVTTVFAIQDYCGNRQKFLGSMTRAWNRAHIGKLDVMTDGQNPTRLLFLEVTGMIVPLP